MILSETLNAEFRKRLAERPSSEGTIYRCRQTLRDMVAARAKWLASTIDGARQFEPFVQERTTHTIAELTLLQLALNEYRP
jgi:hypothetical protein